VDGMCLTSQILLFFYVSLSTAHFPRPRFGGEGVGEGDGKPTKAQPLRKQAIRMTQPMP